MLMLDLFKDLSFCFNSKRSKRKQLKLLERSDSYTVDQKQWVVPVRGNKYVLRFRLHETALNWCTKNEVGFEYIECRKTSYIKPCITEWLLGQLRQGYEQRPLATLLKQMHPDNYDQALECIDANMPIEAIHEWISYSFALGRSDGTPVVAAWIQQHPLDWFNADYLFNRGTRTACLIGRLFETPLVLSWLMEQQPQLKKDFSNDSVWSAFNNAFRVNTRHEWHLYWPSASWSVFQRSVEPFNIPARNQFEWMALIKSYTHDPAAQMYLIYKQWRTEPTKVLTAQFKMEPQLQGPRMFYEALRKGSRGSSQTLQIEQLLLAVDLDYKGEAFYEHATYVFGSRIDEPSIKDIDSAIFNI